jgi:hypothetical protein
VVDSEQQNPRPEDSAEPPQQRPTGRRETGQSRPSPFRFVNRSLLSGFSGLNYAVNLQTRLNSLSVINSDVFRMAQSASYLNNLSAVQLTRNIDFGFSSTLAKLTSGFAAQQVSLFGDLGSLLTDITQSIYPPNLRDIEDLRIKEVREVVMVDGIPLYAVPRTSIAEALIDADGASKRRDILGRRAKAISADCRDAVDACKGDGVSAYTSFALSALDALDAGHPRAAQALAGSLIDTLLTGYFKDKRHLYTPDKKGNRTNAVYNDFSVREFIAFAPMWQAYQKYFVGDGDRVPHTFSRNATAHTVSPRQFTRRNAVQGLMFACSLLVFFNDEEKRLRARRRSKATR